MCARVRICRAEKLLTMVDLCADKGESVRANAIMEALALHSS